MFSVSLMVFFIIGKVSASTLPEDLPVCRRSNPNLDNCLVNFFNSLRLYHKTGIKAINLPPFDPLSVGNINASHYSQEAQFVTTFREFVYYGLKNYRVTHVQLNETTLTAQVIFGNLRLRSYFELDGKFLNVPIRGDGLIQAVQFSASAKIAVTSNLIHNKGVAFCNVTSVNFDLKMKDAEVQVIGLDKKGATSEFLNNNSKVTANVMTDVFSKVLGLHFQKYVVALCNDVPFYEFSPILLQ